MSKLIEIQTGPDQYFYADWDLYSVLREEPEFNGVDIETGQAYELTAEQLFMVWEWFDKPENSGPIFEYAQKSVSDEY